jgi:hypothetical protein
VCKFNRFIVTRQIFHLFIHCVFSRFLYCVAACQAACCGYGFSVALPLALQKAVFRVAKGRELQRERPCFAS